MTTPALAIPADTDPILGAWLPSSEQADLAGMLRDLLDARSATDDVFRAMESPVGHDESLWRDLAELGICGMAVPESLGGSGATFLETSIAAEELGRSLACVPFFSSAVLAQSALLASSNASLQERWLPQLAAGLAIGTVALAEPNDRWDALASGVSAQWSDHHWTLVGAKSVVPDGHVADLILVFAQSAAGVGLWAVDGDARGLSRTQLPVMDQTRRLARLELHDVPAELVVAPGEASTALAQTIDLAVIALAAECLGGARRTLETATEYAKTRVQFGRAIGSFQAVKHRCADMLIQTETAESAVSYARHVLGAPYDPALALVGSVAKAACGDAYSYCSAENIQVHGGIGFTWEHSAHLYFKRARTNQVLLGDSFQHRSRVGDFLGI
jgi:alkylation response protein AidB-like acyl-CoA dehydrogenase